MSRGGPLFLSINTSEKSLCVFFFLSPRQVFIHIGNIPSPHVPYFLQAAHWLSSCDRCFSPLNHLYEPSWIHSILSFLGKSRNGLNTPVMSHQWGIKQKNHLSKPVGRGLPNAAWLIPRLCRWMELFLFWCRTLHFPLLNFMRFLFIHFP